MVLDIGGRSDLYLGRYCQGICRPVFLQCSVRCDNEGVGDHTTIIERRVLGILDLLKGKCCKDGQPTFGERPSLNGCEELVTPLLQAHGRPNQSIFLSRCLMLGPRFRMPSTTGC